MGLRVAVTGPTGMLGRALRDVLSSQHDVVPVERATVGGSLTSPGAVDDILALKPDAIIHTAANTDLAACEKDPDAARALHADLPRRLARACRENGVRLLHVSTDHVYPDRHELHKEEDAILPPPGVYAATKWAGDTAVQTEDPRALVLRASLLGSHPDAKRTNLISWMLRELRAGASVGLYEDQISSAMFVGDLALEISRLLPTGASGALNVGLDRPASRVELGTAIARAAGLNEKLVISTRLADALRTAPRGYPVPQFMGLYLGRWRAMDGRPPSLDVTARRIVEAAA